VLSTFNVVHWILFGGNNASAGVGIYPTLRRFNHRMWVAGNITPWSSTKPPIPRRLSHGSPAALGLAASRAQPGAVSMDYWSQRDCRPARDHFFGELDDIRFITDYCSLTTFMPLPSGASGSSDYCPTISRHLLQVGGGRFHSQRSGFRQSLNYAWKKGTRIFRVKQQYAEFWQSATDHAGTYSVIVSNTQGTTNSIQQFFKSNPQSGRQFGYGLVANWGFDETNGVTAADSSGRSNSAFIDQLSRRRFPMGDRRDWRRSEF